MDITLVIIPENSMMMGTLSKRCHRQTGIALLKAAEPQLKTIGHLFLIGHLFYTTLSFVHHFKMMGKLKLELQSGNAQFGSKSAIFI